MSNSPSNEGVNIEPVVSFRNLAPKYGKTLGLDHVTLDIPARKLIGMIGPDGVGKSTLLSLVTGAHAMQEGDLRVLGGDMRDKVHRNKVCPKIAYMPQGLGKNLYFTLTVEENLQFFARLFGHNAAERRRRIDRLTKSTGLYPFLDRPAGKLSGGMKQKLGLCCSLIHDPDLLVLDEPTTGVDPLARRQFWDLVDSIREAQENMSVIVATAYMDEAQRFDWLIAMNDGKILDTGTPAEILKKTGKDNLDDAFIELLPEEQRAGHKTLVVPPLETTEADGYSIEAEGLTKRFGTFTAVDHVSFRIRKGEIFGFLGSNGCGKTTTMRMLTGLLPATEGVAKLFGNPIDGNSLETRKHLGYMTQLFSLYGDLTVRQNLVLYAHLYQIPEDEIPGRVDALLNRFQLKEIEQKLPNDLPLGLKQRLSLAAAVIHNPEIVILDEPTSGVDPVARDLFWELIIDLSRKDKVTIFITTHFMNEAGRCDRISLMHSGRSLVCDTPANIVAQRNAATLEEAFIGCLEDADPESNRAATESCIQNDETPEEEPAQKGGFLGWLTSKFSFQRWYTCYWREQLELLRDPVRATLALFGALILMVVIGYGINMDVEDLSYAILDNDKTEKSTNYALNLSGSRYFVQHPDVKDHADLDRRMANGELSVVVEFPPKFGKDVDDGNSPEVAYWIDGANPSRASTINGYVGLVHNDWLTNLAQYSSKREPDLRRDALPVQPGRGEPARHGPRDHPDPDDDDPRHPGRAVRRPREGDGLHHQPVCDAAHQDGVPARETVPVPDLLHAQRVPADRDGSHHLRRPGQGQLPDAARFAARLLCGLHRLRPAGVLRDAQPDRRDLPHHARHDASLHPALRPDQPGRNAEGRRAPHRQDLPRHAHASDQPRRLQQGARLRGAAP